MQVGMLLPSNGTQALLNRKVSLWGLSEFNFAVVQARLAICEASHERMRQEKTVGIEGWLGTIRRVEMLCVFLALQKGSLARRALSGRAAVCLLYSPLLGISVGTVSR